MSGNVEIIRGGIVFNETPGSGSLIGDDWIYGVLDLPLSTPTNLSQPLELSISHNLNSTDGTKNEQWAVTELVHNLRPWLEIPDTFITTSPQDPSVFENWTLLEAFVDLSCTEPKCSSVQICRTFYNCFFDAIASEKGVDSPDLTQVSVGPNRPPISVSERDRDGAGSLAACLPDALTDGFRCGVVVIPTNRKKGNGASCSGPDYEPDLANWKFFGVDSNLQTFVQGDQDFEGVYWPGLAVDGPFAQPLGKRLTKNANYQCSLEYPCTYQLSCDEIGSWTAIGLGDECLPSQRGYFVLVSLQNLNQQLSNQYVAIKGALGILALDTFLIDYFYPKPGSGFELVNALTGLGTILSVVSGFVPVIGPALGAAGAILPTVGTFLGNAAAATTDPLVVQKTFAPKVREIYTNYVNALDDAGTKLFRGESVQGAARAFNITDMIKGGSWVNSSALTKLAYIETNLTTELLARSIDDLWKTPPYNKMWVLFVDLAEDVNSTSQCSDDLSGPQDSKYCADGGVYYTYNFVEDGHMLGYVDYPWGGDQLQTKFKIDLKWVTEASARGYQLAKANGTIDPFNVTGQIGTETFLTAAVNDNTGRYPLLYQAGRYPGTWTLPVCNASTWGKAWNWDYTTADYDKGYKTKRVIYSGEVAGKPKSRRTHPPCLCGEMGKESDAWAKAAGLQDFQTCRERCTSALEKKDFQWPEGLTEVTYTGSSSYTVRKPGA